MNQELEYEVIGNNTNNSLLEEISRCSESTHDDKIKRYDQLESLYTKCIDQIEKDCGQYIKRFDKAYKYSCKQIKKEKKKLEKLCDEYNKRELSIELDEVKESLDKLESLQKKIFVDYLKSGDQKVDEVISKSSLNEWDETRSHLMETYASEAIKSLGLGDFENNGLSRY